MNKKTCFHCGLPVPKGMDLTIHYQSEEKPACCAGCQAVAQSIIDSGLGQYYEQRTAQALQAALPPQELLEQIKLYDLPEVQADFVEIKSENEHEALLMLSGITCAACVWLIEQQLLHLPGIVRVDLNYSTHRARVAWDNSRVKLSDILLKIQQSGYDASPYDAMRHEESAQKERKQAILRLWVAGLSMMQVMMYALPTYLFGDIEPEFLHLLHWAGMILTLPVIVYSAVPFYQGAWRDIKNRRVGMDVPIALAVILAFSASTIALLQKAGEGIFFDSISMFVFLLLGGRYLEKMARRKAADATERLVKLVPAFCHRLPEYPQSMTQEEAVVAKLQCNDVILVKAGEIIVADGIVIEGESEVNEAMLTGESLPQVKNMGNKVTAGTTNIASPLLVQVSNVGSNTRLGGIVRLLDTALSQKPRMARIADRYASWFVAALLILAACIFVLWTWQVDANKGLWVTVSLLVITCPCALSLATPAALAAATGNLTSKGLLIGSAHSLEGLAKINQVIFDKTGTLTEGKLNVQHALFATQNSDKQQHIINIACALEAQSEHPIARALCHHYPQSQAVSLSNLLNSVGQGVSAQTKEGQIWRIGNIRYVSEIAGDIPDWLKRQHIGTIVALGNQHGFQAAFYLSDVLKEGAKQTVVQLAKLGLNTHLLSGDNNIVSQHIAQMLNIKHVRAEASPEEKLDYVAQLQRNGHCVLMVGDGVNDAPVLAQADVSIAMDSGADVSREGSDMVMMNHHLHLLPQAVEVGRRTRHIIQENLLWALTYNAIAVPIAATGHATPAVAALGMACSSLLVVLNALRLLRN